MFGTLKGQVIASVISTSVPLLSILLSMKTLTIYYTLMVEKTSTLFMKILVALLCLLILKVIDAWFIYLKMVSVSSHKSQSGQVLRATKLRRDQRQAAQIGEWNNVWIFVHNLQPTILYIMRTNQFRGGKLVRLIWSQKNSSNYSRVPHATELAGPSFYVSLTKLLWKRTATERNSLALGQNGLYDKANMFLWLRLWNWMENSCLFYLLQLADVYLVQKNQLM